MKGQKEAVVILQEIKKIQLKYRRAQKEKRRRSRERRALAGLPPTTSDEDTSDEEIIPPVKIFFAQKFSFFQIFLNNMIFRKIILKDENEVYLKMNRE